MPHYLIKEKAMYPTLVYEAPVDEKTKELRKKFDVDEETGYPRHYSWRNMAKLGSVYKPEDPFYKFGEYTKEQGYSTKMCIVTLSAFVAGLAQYVGAFIQARPLYSKPQYPIAIFCLFAYLGHWTHEKTIERSSRKNMIFIDYMRKHPDRFEPIHRPKLREVLWWQVPIR